MAVYSDADAQAPFVGEADQAVAIGPAPAAESYLVAAKILEAARQTGAQAIHPDGKPFTLDNIGGALASRAVGEHLRSMGEITGGPRAFTPADRSRFLQALDAAVVKARRARV